LISIIAKLGFRNGESDRLLELVETIKTNNLEISDLMDEIEAILIGKDIDE